MVEEKIIQDILEEPLKEKGFSLVLVKKHIQDGALTLEIILDREEAISLDDIIEMSNFIGELLDKKNIGDEAYTLDVSSLGVEKPIPIEKLKEKVGSYVHLTLNKSYKGFDELEGTLLESPKEKEIVLSFNQKGQIKKASLNLNDIQKARYAVKF